LNNELGNVTFGWRSTWPACCGTIVLLSDEIAIPTQQSVRCHDAGYSIEPGLPKGIGKNASLRRWSLVRCRRFFPSCSRKTRFSSN